MVVVWCIGDGAWNDFSGRLFDTSDHSVSSMVDWRPLMGVVPPVGESAWNAVFGQYKAYPEYQKVNAGMTLAFDFKFIFYFGMDIAYWVV